MTKLPDQVTVLVVQRETSQQIVSLITTIRSYAEILKDYGDLTPIERSEFAATLVGESEEMATQADNMFDFMSGHGIAGLARHRARRSRTSSPIAPTISRLEEAADQTLAQLARLPTLEALSDLLQRGHGIGVRTTSAESLPADGELLDGATFFVAERLARASARFRIARLVGTLAFGERLDTLVAEAALSSPEASRRLRQALASYFAGALLMPYQPFRAAIDSLRLDIALIGHRFDASFEQVCQRLTSMRRPGAEGLPLHFLRTDIAGNITKRFSASGLRLPRYGGACSRWIIHHAFTSPGRIFTQVARLPGGETFFFVARANASQGSMGANERNHAVMIGCAIEHAHRFVYAEGSISLRRRVWFRSASPAGNARGRIAANACSIGSCCPKWPPRGCRRR